MVETRLSYSLPDFLNDVPEVVRAYSPFIVCSDDAESFILLSYFDDGEGWRFEVKSDLAEDSVISGRSMGEGEDILDFKRLVKRACKVHLYAFCKNLCGVDLPYGCLTGVRPTKLFREMIERGEDAVGLFGNSFNVSEERIELVKRIVDTQKSFFDAEGKGVDIFVNVPFCPTRCKYCSFISTEVGRIRKQIPEYIDAVKSEIEGILASVEDKSKIRAIYVGGGTPTSLNGEELEDMLGGLRNLKVEFTVEAGRPDSFTREKLEALKRLNVTRISVNPQTLKDETLTLIGRSHTKDDFYRAYGLAREFGFDINVDLIAGLPDEDFEDFKATLTGVLALRPENVTVHTLALKRGATLKNEGAVKTTDGSVRQMVDFARNTLFSSGYNPYYMYRQKNMADNLENVGYSLPGKECLYNVDYMEETTTILSAGAGAMSKFVYKEQNRIERSANPKGLNEYLERKGNKERK